MGRDLWKSTKRNQGFVIALMAMIGAITLPTLGARELIRGHDRGPVGTLFKTVIGSIMLVLVGLALAVMCFSFLTHDKNDPDASMAAAIFLGVSSTAIFGFLGILWGLI